MGFSLGKIFSGVPFVKDAADALFGDVTGKGAQKAQAAENLATREFLKQQAEQARGDIFRLFPAAEEARQLGTQGALDIFGQTIPQQAQTFQAGNVGAQQTLQQGLPQILAALRGEQIDLSQLQPQRLQFDPSFAQQTLPDFTSTRDIANVIQRNERLNNPQIANALRGAV